MSASAPACATGSSGAPASVEPRAIAEAPAQALEVATAGAEREPGLSCAALERSATVLHDDGERHKSQDSRVAALELYDLYLRRCPDEPEYAELLYYRAELLWAIAATRYETDEEAGKRDFARAHVAFNRVLARGPSRHTRDAAYAQMLAKLNELEWDDGPLRTASSLKVRAEHRFVRSPYTRAERELLALSLIHI